VDDIVRTARLTYIDPELVKAGYRPPTTMEVPNG
jgi:hypothetical protein